MNKTNSALWEFFQPRILLAILLLLIAGLACNKPQASVQTGDEDGTAYVETSVALTMMAMEGNTDADSQSSGGDNEDAVPPSETPEPEPPTFTPTVTDTPTPEVARVYSSANTNCRTGQGTYFPWLVTIQQGETPEAVGIDTSGDYWYVRRPDVPSQFCWMWGKYATPMGPWQSLPVYTPIPTPTPGFDFKLTFIKLYQCGVWWNLQFQIDNTGSKTLESWKATGVDNSGGLTNSPNEQNSFYDASTCMSLELEQQDLTPGEGSYMNAVFQGNPDDHDLTLKFKVCTEDNLGGECLRKEFDFTP